MKKKLKFTIFSSALGAFIIIAVALMCIYLRPAKEENLTLTVSPTTLVQDSTKALNFSCSKQSAELKFEVYDEEIASVVEGVVIAHKVGTTSVRVTAVNDGEKAVASASVVVTENPEGPIVDLPSEITLYVLDKNLEEAKEEGFSNEIAFNTFRSFTSSVSNNCVKVTKSSIIANKPGEAVISFSSSTTTYSVFVRVLEIKPEIVGLPTSISLMPHESFDLGFSILPSFYTGDADIKIEDPNNIISTSGSTITAISSGKTELKVSLNDEEHIIPVVVTSILHCEMIAIENCEIINNAIYINSGEIALIKFKLWTDEGAIMNMSLISFETEDIKLGREMDYIKILATKNGRITISANDLASSVTISVFVK